MRSLGTGERRLNLRKVELHDVSRVVGSSLRSVICSEHVVLLEVVFNNVNVVNQSGTTSTNSQTISGIDNVIELRVVTTTGGGDAYSIRPRVNGNFFITNPQNSPADFTFRVSNGDSLDFFLDTVDRTENGSVTITNVSDGNAAIDTFSVTLEID